MQKHEVPSASKYIAGVGFQWAGKHASHYVLPGARLLPVAGAFTALLSFRNPNGAYALILHNGKETEVTPVIRVGKRQLSLTLKPKSYNTIVLPG